MWVKVSPKVLVKLVSPLLLFIALAVAVASVAARRSQRTTRGLLELAGAIKCSTGRNALAYMMYGCYCGLGGQGWPRDKADWWGRALITLLSNLTEENSSMSTLLLFLKISCLQTKMKTPNWHSIHDPPKHYVVQKISLSMHWMWLVLHGAHTWFQFFSVIYSLLMYTVFPFMNESTESLMLRDRMEGEDDAQIQQTHIVQWVEYFKIGPKIPHPNPNCRLLLFLLHHKTSSPPQTS